MPIIKTPGFWYNPRLSALQKRLLPLSRLYGWTAQCRQALINPQKVRIPVICVGNFVMGGAGKTPAALALAAWLIGKGYAVHFLTRGYGGSEGGPLQVDLNRHKAPDVGDEALLLAQTAPTWVSRDRVLGAQAAEGHHAQILIMDDGFQNPSLFKDLSLVVVDGLQGLGNSYVFPAGPLREPLERAVKRADAILFIGEDRHNIRPLFSGKLLLKCSIVPDETSLQFIRQKPLIAFAGLGYPEKFFELLKHCSANLIEKYAFPDHHPYSLKDLEPLIASAKEKGAWLVTTEKDRVRVPNALQSQVKTFKIKLEFESPSGLRDLLQTVL